MTFKDQIARDVSNTFANTWEFFDWRDIDGKQMRVMTDDYELLDREKFSKQQGGSPGMKAPQNTRVLIYVPVEDYGPRPKTGKLLLWENATQYRIEQVSEEAGIYAFTLERNRT